MNHKTRSCKNLLKRGDYEMVAEAAGISKILVRKVVNGEREDRHRIMDRLQILFEERERIHQKLKAID